MARNLMIMAAGVSSRMRRSAEIDGASDATAKEALSKPKMMLSVGGRPFLDYLLFNAREAGYSDILFVINEKDDTVRNYYTENADDEKFSGLTFSFVNQTISKGRSKPLGTADAVLSGLEARRDWAGQKFTVCNSDNLYSVGALTALRLDDHLMALIDYERDALGVEQERVNAFAVIWKNKDGFITDIVEKPNVGQVEKAADENGRVGVSMNIFRLDYNFIIPLLRETPLHPERDEKELTETVRMLVRQKPDGMFTISLSEAVPDLTTLGDIEKVDSFISPNC
ncbi:MAG: sugar phosphate nucleotidyltransferase [Candidatus Neomarinimicrobiota bacterium]|nr:sugar phosphate nucleotidyltransferase [Candidatus Neomarinimicrobiota bacterium]